jgi:phosphatidylglycerophosphatase A
MQRLALLVATSGYAGYFPIAPGTVGSAAGLVVYAVLRVAGAGALVELATIVAVFAIGTWASSSAERHFGKKDPGPVVIDEVAGQLITLALVPVSVGGAIAGFLLFRVSDIVKPWPSDRLEHLPSGLGIMSDDAMAGLYANIALRLAAWLFPALLV